MACPKGGLKGNPMSEFLITSPEGKKYRVTGPSGSSKEGALQVLQQHLANAKKTKLQIGDRVVEVGDNFLTLSPEEQQQTVDEIERSLSGNPLPSNAKQSLPRTEALRERARQELNTRKAKAELERRRAVQPARSSGLMGKLETLNEWMGGSNLPPDQRTPGKLQSLVSGIGNTLSFGLSDELMSAGVAPLRGKSYGDQLAETRQIQGREKDTNPKTYLGGQIAGAALPAFVTMGSNVAPTLGGNIIRGGGFGSLSAGAYGFGEGEGGFGNRALNAGINAPMGGFFGSTAPVIARGIGATWNGVSKALARSGIADKAQGVVLDMLKKAGMSPHDAVAKLDELGPEAMLADLAQIEAAGTARASTNAGKVMGERLAARRESGGRRVGSALDEAFGPAQDPYAVLEASRAAKSQINPAYREAITNAPEMPKGAPDVLAKELTSHANGLSLDNRALMGRYMTSMEDALAADSPDLTASRLLDLRKSLDSQIVYGGREQMMLAPADRAAQGVIKQARAHVDQVLKRFVPGIAEADARHAPLSRQQSAFDYGRKEVLKGGSDAITPAQLTNKIAALTRPERIMITQGIRTELSRMLANTRNNPAVTADRVTSRDWNRDKIRTLVGDSKTDGLEKAINRESLFTETSNLIEPSRNSRTAVLTEATERWKPRATGSGAAGDIAGAFMGGSAAGGLPAGAAAATGVGLRKLGRALFKSDKVDEALVSEVADYLSRSGGARNKVLEDLLEKYGKELNQGKTGKGLEQIIRRMLASQSALAADNVNQSFRGPRLPLPALQQ
jgi:hypothetical protein